MSEIGASRTIAVPMIVSLRHKLLARVGNTPKVVKEVVSAFLLRFVAQDDARSTMVIVTGGMHNQLLLGSMSKMWRVRWGCVPIRIGNENVFVTMCS